MKRLTAAWIRKAEDDYRVANELSTSKPPSHDHVCFCCQQAAEKYLKALLEELGRPVPRTHNLEDLYGLLLATYRQLSPLRRGLKFLKSFAVDYRYPGFRATKRQATAALRWADRVRQTTRTILDI